MEKIFKLQNELTALVKEQVNPFFKSKYFDINQVIGHLKPLLEKHGLIVLQPLTNLDGKFALKTIVIDADDGKVIIEDITPLTEPVDAQKAGSSITYFRRYALQSLFLLQSEDDDANVASGKKSKVDESLSDENPF